MKKLSEFQIETFLKEFLSKNGKSQLIRMMMKKCDPLTQLEKIISSIFNSIQMFDVVNPFTKVQYRVISMGITENICRYSDNVIIVIDQNSEYQIFHCTVFDYTLEQSVFIFQIK